MYTLTSQAGYVREVTGEVVSSFIAKNSFSRIEMFERQHSSLKVEWHFCQPELTLFWHKEGFQRMRARVNGRHIQRDLTGGSNISIFAPECRVDSEFDADKATAYVAVFFSPEVIRRRWALDLNRSEVGLCHQAIRRSLADICREAQHGRSLFELYAEGSAMQVLALMGRLLARGDDRAGVYKGGLPARKIKWLQDFIQENFSAEIRLDELAQIAGVSKRHLLRAFAQSLGTTPHRYVLARRIEAAKQLLRRGIPVTEVALDVGFSHAQHFATTFRRLTGATPSEYRDQVAR